MDDIAVPLMCRVHSIRWENASLIAVKTKIYSEASIIKWDNMETKDFSHYLSNLKLFLALLKVSSTDQMIA